jgi:hypothetical protein
VVPARRRVAVERLVRALLVELLLERPEAPLLPLGRLRRRLRRFGLERAVQPLVPAVLLRVRRLDELGRDPELESS